ncbi:MAG: hypothetical protein ACXWKG_12705 [Limisphaerales bacterium]
MKAKKQAKGGKYPAHKPKGAKLRDALMLRPAETLQGSPMIRTQIYLSRLEHEFVQAEASRLGTPMAAVIREYIDEKMELPDDVWVNNPLLDQPLDPDFVGPEDGAINHDHYLYGGPKKWIKQHGEWVEAPPLPDDYFENPASANAYDEMLRKLEEEERKR